MIKPPCKKNNKDCPTRRVGCQSKCREYKDYRVEIDKQNQYNHHPADLYAADYYTKVKFRSIKYVKKNGSNKGLRGERA